MRISDWSSDVCSSDLIGITLGQAFDKAVGDKKGLVRYGHSYVPLDEALSRVVVDLSGRPGLEYNVEYPRAMIGDFDVDLLREFFQGLVNHAKISVHIDNLRGRTTHHIDETVFKEIGSTSCRERVCQTV